VPFGISIEESARKKEKESAGIRGDPRGMGAGGNEAKGKEWTRASERASERAQRGGGWIGRSRVRGREASFTSGE